MLVACTCLEVLHHICKSRLGRGLSPFLLNFVHLFQIFLGGCIYLLIHAFWLRSPLTFGSTTDLEATAHGGVHDWLCGGCHLL